MRVKTGTATGADLKEPSLGRRPNQLQAQPNPLGQRKTPLETGNTSPNCSFFLYVTRKRRKLSIMRTASCFGILPHDEQTSPSIRLQVPLAPGQHPEAKTSTPAWAPTLLSPSAPRQDQEAPAVPRPCPLGTAQHRRAAGGPPRYSQAEDVLALPQGHGLPQDAGAVGRARRNTALLTRAATRRKTEEGRKRVRGTSITSGSSSAPSPAAPARRGCGTRGARAAPWRGRRDRGDCPGPAGCPSARAAPPSSLPSLRLPGRSPAGSDPSAPSALPAAAPNRPPAGTAQARGRARCPPSAFPALREAGGAGPALRGGRGNGGPGGMRDGNSRRTGVTWGAAGKMGNNVFTCESVGGSLQ